VFILGGCDGVLFVIKFPFVQYQVCEVINGILVYAFHEAFYASLWDVEVF
jgi:hypothetical protein